MVEPTHQSGYDSFVRALLQFSGRGQTHRHLFDHVSSEVSTDRAFLALDHSHEAESLADYETPSLIAVSGVAHAEPLAPLRYRDEQALIELFTHERIEEIAEEIQARLNCLYPEPCWDDEPFEFLQRYL